MSELEMRALMCDVGRRMWQRDLVGAGEGNLSARVSPLRILCTPSGVCKGTMKPSDLVVIDNHGSVIGEGRPSSEILMHLRVYKHRPDCQAVVHAHPITATAFAVAGEDIPDAFLPEAAHVLGSVATVAFGMPGTSELPDALEPLLQDHKAFLLSHHGAMTLGKDLLDAYHRMETLERIARILLAAKQLGGPAQLPECAYRQLSAVALNGKL